MKRETRDRLDELLDALDGLPDVEVTRTECIEYHRGDPTMDSEVSGAEVELTAFFSFDVEDDTDSPYRVK